MLSKMWLEPGGRDNRLPAQRRPSFCCTAATTRASSVWRPGSKAKDCHPKPKALRWSIFGFFPISRLERPGASDTRAVYSRSHRGSKKKVKGALSKAQLRTNEVCFEGISFGQGVLEAHHPFLFVSRMPRSAASVVVAAPACLVWLGKADVLSGSFPATRERSWRKWTSTDERD